MAIEVKTYPGTYQSVHGDLLYVVYEATKVADPVTYPDYRYMADVYAESEYVARIKAYPDPVTGMGIFNLSSIFRNYITPAFNPVAATFLCQTLNSGDFNVSGVVVFGEEYDFVQYPATIGGVGRTFYGHYNGRLLGSSTNLTDYVGKVASIRPVRTKMYRDASFYFIPVFKDTGNIDIEIKQYDSSNTLISTITDAYTGTTASMKVFNIANPGINELTAPGILSDAEYMTVQLGTGPLLTIDLVCEPKYTTYSLHFLNRFGGFETRDFTKVSRKLLDIEKKDFGKLPYTVNASGEVSYYNSNNVYNETRSVYASQYKEKMTLNTDILTDEEYTWLGDLILSPMVFIEMSGYFIPIVISRNNYEFRKVVNDKLTNLTIDIEFGEQFATQYR